MKAVHFGAGNIGRGFIGQLLFNSGYEVVFADVNEELIQQLKAQSSYTIYYAEEEKRSFEVTNFTGLHSNHDKNELLSALKETELITTAVGAPVLKHIAPVIAEALKLRLSERKSVAVIACENAVNATDTLKEHIAAAFDEQEWKQLSQFVSFPNAAVDRIVPIQSLENPLDVLVEPFYEWTIDTSGFTGPVPVIEGAHFVDNLSAYIERKLYTVNTGHAAAAYHGYAAGYETVQEAMQDEQVLAEVKNVLLETGDLLIGKYSFHPEEHQSYIETTIYRYQNPELSDQITRVARQPLKKLGLKERLTSPAVQLFEQGKHPAALIRVITAALRYNETSDEEALELQKILAEQPLPEALSKITSLSADHALIKEIEKQYQR
ncbi:mannitol-1-phosphate 5-dehydrogenase [Alkalicoccus daliensis]|uniref:Mannitol-1-phosphate 5-dehydrogenase n=1 Tax=Alkalicoccus daliensis TaxID=745820 RepID=A0A1H0ESD1_9BACI|nr:mannitol-1-phosphate 5-dehydrogenase [Alkalicoccus daliensis]SDN85213.1 mannitol-1-phosphate 5-dehydrogenase [Alkalicoccus daliensis]